MPLREAFPGRSNRFNSPANDHKGASAMARYEKISYERDGDIAIIAFDDDKTLNACGVDTAIELLHALEVAAKEARCTILTGKGRGFCSGANLGGMGSGPALAHPD